VRLLDRFDEALDSFHQRAGDGFDALDNAFGLFRYGHRLKGFFFVDFGGSLEIRLAKLAFAGISRGMGFRGGSFGRQTGGDILSLIDFMGVSPLVDFVLGGLVGDDLGAGLDGVAIGALLDVAQSAGGAEAHPTAAPPGEISVTHS
jgi:hypothetical protein